MPSSTEHERHDRLLVARFATDDAIDAAEQGTAAALVAACSACAELASDIRLLSGTVAREPMPPRRRDFRIAPERAEQLRGGPLQRFLRRLSVPQAAALRPVGAGVMAVGLLMIVAGTFWPQGVDLAPREEPGVMLEAASSPAGTFAFRIERATGADASLAPEAMDPAAPDAGLADDSELVQEAPADDLTAGDEVGTTNATAGEASLVPDAFGAAPPNRDTMAQAESQEAAPRAGTGPEQETTLEMRAEPGEDARAEAQASTDVVTPQRSLGLVAPADGAAGDVSGLDEAAPAEPGVADDAAITVERVLLVIGLVLLAAGLALVAVTWLARRFVGDPLLR